MDFLGSKSSENMIGNDMEKDVTESRKVTERELAAGVAPAARQAFSRKPYYNMAGSFLKKPVLR